MVLLQVRPVAQQQPTTLLDHLASGLVMAKGIGLVYPDTVDHIASIAGNHVEQVVNDFRPRAMLLHFQIEGRIHVHRHSLDLLATLAEQLEEGADGLAAVTQTDPQNAGTLGIHDHCRVTMTLVQSELVHHQTAHIARLEGAECGLQTPFVQGLDGVPVQPGELADMADGQQLQEGFDPGAQTAGDSRGRGQPGNVLGHSPAPQAVHSAHRESQLDVLVEQVPVADEANSPVMDQWTELLTATTTRQVGRSRFEAQREGVFSGMVASYDVIAWPESSKINRMHGDSRDR